MSRLANSDFTGQTTTVAWMGMDNPDAIVADAPDPSYAEAGGPALRDFMWGLGTPQTADTTVIGHSYGGATVGVADRDGMEVDRIVMIEPAGAGRGVFTISDYGEGATDRHIDHYTMTAPGDLIWLSQHAPMLAQMDYGIGHGGNPQTMPGFTVLDTGYFDDTGTSHGARIEGVDAHTAVLKPGTTVWRNVYGIVTGQIKPDPIPLPDPGPTPPPTPGVRPDPNATPNPQPGPAPRPTGAP